MNKKFILQSLGLLAVSAILYVLSRTNYLLFHGIAEFYSIIIATGIFIVSWNTRKIAENQNLVFLGILYLFVGIFDFFHTLAYKGMNVLPDDLYYANQLWVAARFIQSAGLLLFALIGPWGKKISPALLFAVFASVTTILLSIIFIFKIFPLCFIDGEGQTLFKIVSEYVICLILLTAIFLIRRRKTSYDPLLYRQVVLSIILTIVSEFLFTLYTDNFGVINVMGHILKIISFYLIYQSVIVNTLERPYDVLYRSLAEAKKSAERANETKDKFFRIIAHDLRNPFNAIMGFGSILQEKYRDSPGDDNARYINYINSSAESAYTLLENLLKWSMSQTRTISYRPMNFSISGKIKAVMKSCENSARLKNISMKNGFPENITVYGDSDMIDTVIRNLISNAIKFTRPGGTIEISGFAVARSVQVNITDNGIGMDTSRVETLFSLEAKQSLHGTAGETGSGLGLILSREFVEWNKGSIWAVSRPGKEPPSHLRCPAGRGVKGTSSFRGLSLTFHGIR